MTRVKGSKDAKPRIRRFRKRPVEPPTATKETTGPPNKGPVILPSVASGGRPNNGGGPRLLIPPSSAKPGQDSTKPDKGNPSLNPNQDGGKDIAFVEGLGSAIVSFLNGFPPMVIGAIDKKGLVSWEPISEKEGNLLAGSVENYLKSTTPEGSPIMTPGEMLFANCLLILGGRIRLNKKETEDKTNDTSS